MHVSAKKLHSGKPGYGWNCDDRNEYCLFDRSRCRAQVVLRRSSLLDFN